MPTVNPFIEHRGRPRVSPGNQTDRKSVLIATIACVWRRLVGATTNAEREEGRVSRDRESRG